MASNLFGQVRRRLTAKKGRRSVAPAFYWKGAKLFRLSRPASSDAKLHHENANRSLSVGRCSGPLFRTHLGGVLSIACGLQHQAQLYAPGAHVLQLRRRRGRSVSREKQVHSYVTRGGPPSFKRYRNRLESIEPSETTPKIYYNTSSECDKSTWICEIWRPVAAATSSLSCVLNSGLLHNDQSKITHSLLSTHVRLKAQRDAASFKLHLAQGPTNLDASVAFRFNSRATLHPPCFRMLFLLSSDRWVSATLAITVPAGT